jgi:hypothetical protein
MVDHVIFKLGGSQEHLPAFAAQMTASQTAENANVGLSNLQQQQPAFRHFSELKKVFLFSKHARPPLALN